MLLENGPFLDTLQKSPKQYKVEFNNMKSLYVQAFARISLCVSWLLVCVLTGLVWQRVKFKRVDRMDLAIHTWVDDWAASKNTASQPHNSPGWIGPRPCRTELFALKIGVTTSELVAPGYKVGPKKRKERLAAKLWSSKGKVPQREHWFVSQYSKKDSVHTSSTVHFLLP